MFRYFMTFVAFGAALSGAGPAVAQTATDYQTAIREAAQAYRGDFVGLVDVVVYTEWYDPRSDAHTPCSATDLFAPVPLALASLQHATSNQALELTATRRALTLSDDYITLNELDARLR